MILKLWMITCSMVIGACMFLLLRDLTDKSLLDEPLYEYDYVSAAADANPIEYRAVKPEAISWGGVQARGLKQIPKDVTAYAMSDNGAKMVVGINKKTSDGNNNNTDRPRAELSIRNGSANIASTTYNLKVDGKTVDNKLAHFTQIKADANGQPTLTVSVGNPKGNKNDYGYLAVMKDKKKWWVNKDGGLSKNFDLSKAVPANKNNKIEIDMSNKNKAVLKINDKVVTDAKGIDGALLKFGAYAGAGKLDDNGIRASFSNIKSSSR